MQPLRRFRILGLRAGKVPEVVTAAPIPSVLSRSLTDGMKLPRRPSRVRLGIQAV
jgi:hypothetical protein